MAAPARRQTMVSHHHNHHIPHHHHRRVSLAALFVKDDTHRGPYIPSTLDLWATAVALAVGGQCLYWPAALGAGTASCALALAAMALAHTGLVYSVAEITSALPFHGGVFGHARCTLGFCPGFVIGCIDLVGHVLRLTLAQTTAGHLLTAAWPSLRPFEPLVWAALVALGAVGTGGGSRLFWRIHVTLVVVALTVVFFYCMGALTLASVVDYGGGTANLFVDRGAHAVTLFPHAAWMYAGLDAFPLLAPNIGGANPSRVLPPTHVSAMLTVLATSLCIFFVAISLPPGAMALPHTLTVLGGGIAASFNVSEHTATLVSLPAAVATVPVSTVAVTNVLAAMGSSRLVPSSSSWKRFVLGAFPSLGVASAVHFATLSPSFVLHLCLVTRFVAAMTHCLAFLHLRLYHRVLPRRRVSPWGAPGAIIALVVFGVATVSLLVCQDDNFVVLSTVAAVGLAATVYYHTVVKHCQVFSQAELQLLLTAHVVHRQIANKRTRRASGSIKQSLPTRRSSSSMSVKRSRKPGHSIHGMPPLPPLLSKTSWSSFSRLAAATTTTISGRITPQRVIQVKKSKTHEEHTKSGPELLTIIPPAKAGR
ncbi:Aste57867_24036 [Aphanomyces stellatus]|uniref:Aste57867_24036 protein n=1 Tax=Aphanomyces stellatus TaxID=120398 RepID=A0A485LQ33_9STRA|nr:hypothetical protein As57867_023963 [Aphanomyces stellatus]VFU00679.1 Aste57867_24036 [Aphanomyces stellatus]